MPIKNVLSGLNCFSACKAKTEENNNDQINRGYFGASLAKVSNEPAVALMKPDADEKQIRSANVIKNFLRKVIAAKSYSRMFMKGEAFKINGNSLEYDDKCASLSSLQHLDTVSKRYVEEIKLKTGALNSDEKELLKKILGVKIILRHQTNGDVVNNGTLTLFSNAKLNRESDYIHGSTTEKDKSYLANDDFVFFAVEFSGDKVKHPLNTEHSNKFYGANAWLLEEIHPYAYLTLTDHLVNNIAFLHVHEHSDFIKKYPVAKAEAERVVHGGKGPKDVPVFNMKDMRMGLGLYLIDFLRNSKDEKFKKFILSDKFEGKKIDRVFNTLFQPEMHVPRIVSTDNFKKVELRKMTIKDAVLANNFSMLEKLINSDKKIEEAKSLAREFNKESVINYISNNFKR